jgi:hypothetical protein
MWSPFVARIFSHRLSAVGYDSEGRTTGEATKEKEEEDNMGDPEQPNNYASEAGESPSEEEHCGRTSKEWWGLLTGSGSIVLIFIGILNLNECGSIQVLPTYIVIYSLGAMSLEVIKFSFRTEKFKKENARLPLDEQTFYATGALADLLAVSMVGVAIWGAVLTFPRLGDYFSKETGFDCPGSVFLSAFVSAILPIAFVGMLLLYGIFLAMNGKCQRQASEDGGEGQENEGGGEGRTFMP